MWELSCSGKIPTRGDVMREVGRQTEAETVTTTEREGEKRVQDESARTAAIEVEVLREGEPHQEDFLDLQAAPADQAAMIVAPISTFAWTPAATPSRRSTARKLVKR